MEDVLQRAQYSPSGIEQKWYAAWEAAGLFAPVARDGAPPFVITLPPPNVTGVLHMGHCLGNSIQDMLIRWMRMRGRETLWVPGTDHASISTEQVVTRQLRQEGLDKHTLGREQFLARAWDWKEQTHGRITAQLRRLGCSLDWRREAFTMDAARSRAVATAFVRLKDKGLIYRDLYLINWCPRCLTAISDDEVDHREVRGYLWHIRYPFADGDGWLTAATTRPETLFGDAAVAVHPDDPHRRRFIGRQVRLPLTDRVIPVIADAHADPEKGTGCVKITPAHDPNDFEVGRRHGLAQIVCMDERGVMNEQAGRFAGLDRQACREAALSALREAGLLEKEEAHVHQVGHHDRCETVIEPRLSRQWFLRMGELAGPAVTAVEDSTIRILPERWIGVYHNWLANLRDWCISRQLWWGHRIPVWYCDDCQLEAAAVETPRTCPRCGSPRLTQDPDVLDTWFSSWLWTFSPLGWPEEDPDLRRYHPNSLLVTGADIIFFWVARMIMAAYEFLEEPPFREVLFHGIVRDAQGRKMSKSLGNSPDPIDLIDKYGADALRCSMVMLTPTGQDVFFAEESLEVGRNFCNKIFQATKLILGAWAEAGLPERGVATPPDEDVGCDLGAAFGSSLGAPHDPAAAVSRAWRAVFGDVAPVAWRPEQLELEDLWLLNRLTIAVNEVNDDLEKRRLNDSAHAVYEFFWHELCDWWLEAAKPRLRDPERRPAAAALGVLVLGTSLKLLHPVMPFLTEELWSWLPPARGFLMTSSYPTCEGEPPFKHAAARFARVAEVVGVLRNLRSELGVPPGRRGRALLRVPERLLEETGADAARIAHLAKLDRVEVTTGGPDPAPAGVGVAGAVEVFLLMEGLVDVERERERLGKELAAIEGFIRGGRAKLDNEQFVARAPAEVVELQRARLRENEELAESLKRRLAALGR